MAMKQELLLLFVAHLGNNQANYNRVLYQQHQENLFPYLLQHLLLHDEELQIYIFVLVHRYSFVNKEDVQQLEHQVLVILIIKEVIL